MLLNVGEKVHVVTRRLFENDIRRHFVGAVAVATENAVRIEGYTFVFEPRVNQFQRRTGLRTRLVSLVDGGVIINVLPPDVDIGRLEYRVVPPSNHLVMTDGNFSLDINEFGSMR